MRFDRVLSASGAACLWKQRDRRRPEPPPQQQQLAGHRKQGRRLRRQPRRRQAWPPWQLTRGCSVSFARSGGAYCPATRWVPPGLPPCLLHTAVALAALQLLVRQPCQAAVRHRPDSLAWHAFCRPALQTSTCQVSTLPGLLPPSHLQAPSGDWVCSMNPDEALGWQGCAAPEEAWEAGGARLLFCPGCVPGSAAEVSAAGPDSRHV